MEAFVRTHTQLFPCPLFAILELKPRARCTLDTHSIPELQTQSHKLKMKHQKRGSEGRPLGPGDSKVKGWLIAVIVSGRLSIWGTSSIIHKWDFLFPVWPSSSGSCFHFSSLLDTDVLRGTPSLILTSQLLSWYYKNGVRFLFLFYPQDTWN